MKYTISIELPKLLCAGDYHAFEERKYQLRELGLKGVKVKELGCAYNYYGVLYMGKLPKKSELAKLLRTNNPDWSLDDCNYFIKHGELP